MTYDPNIPLPTDFLSDSQGDIRNNFTAANNSFGRNHTNFSVVTDPGKHKFIELLNSNPVGVAPAPPLISGEGTLYTKTLSSASQLFYTPDNSAREYQLTRSLDSQFATFGSFVNNYTPQAGGGAVGTEYDAGWTWLAGVSPGLILMYGRYSVSSLGASGTVKFPITLGTAYTIDLTPITTSSGSSQVRALSYTNGSVTTTKFDWNLSSSGSDYRGFFWKVIGVAP